jgi:hypothetical protein
MIIWGCLLGRGGRPEQREQTGNKDTHHLAHGIIAWPAVKRQRHGAGKAEEKNVAQSISCAVASGPIGPTLRVEAHRQKDQLFESKGVQRQRRKATGQENASRLAETPCSQRLPEPAARWVAHIHA